MLTCLPFQTAFNVTASIARNLQIDNKSNAALLRPPENAIKHRTLHLCIPRWHRQQQLTEPAPNSKGPQGSATRSPCPVLQSGSAADCVIQASLTHNRHALLRPYADAWNKSGTKTAVVTARCALSRDAAVSCHLFTHLRFTCFLFLSLPCNVVVLWRSENLLQSSQLFAGPRFGSCCVYTKLKAHCFTLVTSLTLPFGPIPSLPPILPPAIPGPSQGIPTMLHPPNQCRYLGSEKAGVVSATLPPPF